MTKNQLRVLIGQVKNEQRDPKAANKAFNKIYLLFGDSLSTFCVKICRRSEHTKPHRLYEAKDLLHDFMVKARRVIKTFAEHAEEDEHELTLRFENYLKKSIHNMWSDYKNRFESKAVKKKLDAETAYHNTLAEIEAEIDDKKEFSNKFILKEFGMHVDIYSQEFMIILNVLKPNEKAVISSFLFNGIPDEFENLRLATICGIDRNSVRTKRKQIFKKLNKILRKKYS